MPHTLFQMNAVLSLTPVNLGRLIAVVGEDPAMTANLLREARALDREAICEQLLDVIVGLGVRRLQGLVLRTPLLTSGELNSEAYRAWRMHSVLAAVLAESIARVCGTPVSAQARIAGLLHDLGKLPLLLRNQTMCETEELMCDGPAKEGRLCHCEVGNMLGEAWGFSSALCGVLRDHHADDEPHKGLLAVVVAADRLCHRLGVSLDAEMARVYGSQAVAQILDETLPWLGGERKTSVVAQVSRACENWQHTHPGVAISVI